MFKNWFKKKLASDEVRVVLPEEELTLLRWTVENLPCVGMLNSALKDFDAKNIFPWHLSVELVLEDLIENKMPSEEERVLIDPFCDEIIETIKAKGNALFFIRETWNGTRLLVWRVYDPEIANGILKQLIKDKSHPRPIEFKMEHDPAWEKADWDFEQLEYESLRMLS